MDGRMVKKKEQLCREKKEEKIKQNPDRHYQMICERCIYLSIQYQATQLSFQILHFLHYLCCRLFGEALLAHQNLGKVQELLPEGDGCGSARRDGIVLGDWTALPQHVLKIIVEPFILAGVVDGQIDLVIDFPAPAIVIHGSHVDVPAVGEVDFGVQESLFCLEDVDAFHDESLKEHIVEDVPENWLVALPRGEYAGLYSPICCLPHGAVESNHRVVVRLHYFYLLFGPLHHAEDALLYLPLLVQRVVVQQSVLVRWVELRVWINFAEPAQQSLILIFCVQAEAVLVGGIYEMLAILIESNIFCQIIEVLVLVAAVSHACVAALNIGRPDQSVSIGHYQFLVMPAPHVLIEVALQGFQSPLGVEEQKPASAILKALDELLFGPKLYVIHEEHHIHASLAGLYQLQQSSVSSR